MVPQMQKRLEDLASITTGVYEKPTLSGDTLYLQGKHFDEFGRIREELTINPELWADERLEKHLLQDGDILLVAKGGSNRACLYESKFGQAVASSTFFVIRMTSKDVTPDYLQWYFNTYYMKEMFSGLSKGTQIVSLSKNAIADLEIPTPSLEAQRKILEIQSLWDREKALTRQLLNLKDMTYQRQLLHNAKSNPTK